MPSDGTKSSRGTDRLSPRSEVVVVGGVDVERNTRFAGSEPDVETMTITAQSTAAPQRVQ
jgi:hypothetical protein